MLLPCLRNLHAEYIVRNAGLGESQAGIKIVRRNIKNLRYADDTTLMEESEEKIKSFLMQVKEESEKAGLKPNIQKLRSGNVVPSFMANRRGKKMETGKDFIFLGSKSLQIMTAAMKLKDACSLEENLWQTLIAYSKAETVLCQQMSV